MTEEEWYHRGVLIRFPCQPYPSQKDYTEHVLDSLLDAQNGLLESPTGTGKTLALLCAGIAWLNHFKASKGGQNIEVEVKNLLNGLPSSKPQNASAGGVSYRIFYSSRTHTQLAQVLPTLNYNFLHFFVILHAFCF